MTKNRILIIDDHKEFRQMLRSFIEKQFHDVEIKEAVTGEDGVEAAVKERPQVVLVDIHLPLIDGIETAQQIKRYVPECRIITMSTFENKDFMQDVMDCIGKDKIDSELIPLLHKLFEINKTENKKTSIKK